MGKVKRTPQKVCKCRMPRSPFIVFVDNMDGDVYKDYTAMTHGVDHAFRHGARRVTIKKWPYPVRPKLS